MFGNGLDLRCRRLCSRNARLVYVFTRILFTLSGVLVIMLLLAVRDGVDGHSSHPTCLPVHLFTVLTVFLVSVSRRAAL